MASIDWGRTARHVPKPWGHALVPGHYCGKTLHIRAGHSLSLQLHEYKDETIAVHAGASRTDTAEELSRFQSFSSSCRCRRSGSTVSRRENIGCRVTAIPPWRSHLLRLLQY
jgi:hypothetical protein